jgi:hypothetical protein
VWLTIPAILATQVLLARLLDLTTVKGAILFGSLPLLAALVVLLPLGWSGIRQEERAA